MHLYTTRVTLTAALASPTVCPACAQALSPTVVDGRLGFSCPDCQVAWEPELGGMVAVPLAPPGSPAPHAPPGPSAGADLEWEGSAGARS